MKLRTRISEGGVGIAVLGLLIASVPYPARSASVDVLVTVENLSPTGGTLITPVWVAFHDGTFDAFEIGAAASPALERLAEDGDTGALSALVASSGTGAVSGTIASGGAIPPLAPGQRASLRFQVESGSHIHRFFSFASMVIPSNDAFIGEDDPMRHPVFDTAGNFVGGSFLVMGNRVLDAGTEANDEIPENTAFLGQTVPDTGTREAGRVGVHPGFKPAGAGGIRDGTFAGFGFGAADFRAQGYPLARITLSVPQEITVTVENLAPVHGTLLTPVWVGFHDGRFDLFDAGARASAALERLAEDGTTAPLDGVFVASGSGTRHGVISSGGPLPPLAPGQTARMTFLLDPMAASSRYFSYASMVIPSNDAFIGNDDPRRIPVFDERGIFVGGRFTIGSAMVWDGGSEVNDESPTSTAFLGQSAPDTGTPEGGVVGSHPGFDPTGSGGILDGTFAGLRFSAADFKGRGYPVARITLSKPRAVNLTVENLAPPGGTYLTPFWVGFHDGSFDLFDTGAAVGSALERLAEDGDTGPLSTRFAASGAGQIQATVTSGGAAPVFSPGQRALRTFWLDPMSPSSRYLSHASMIIPSNDAFIGNDDPMGMPVFDGAGMFVGGESIVQGAFVWDAGTEVNDEIPIHTAFFGQMMADSGVAEGGLPHPHAGFKARGLGGILDAEMFSGAGFTAPGYRISHLRLSSAPWMREVRVREQQIRLAWVGGEPPFRVEYQDALGGGAWSEMLVTTERLADLPLGGSTGFFRVVGR